MCRRVPGVAIKVFCVPSGTRMPCVKRFVRMLREATASSFHKRNYKHNDIKRKVSLLAFSSNMLYVTALTTLLST